jgi:hypothetical protein
MLEALRRIAPILCLMLAGCMSPPVTAERPSAAPAPALRQAPVEAPSPVALRVLAEAERILTGVKHSVYSHKTAVDEKAASYEMDCSGLVRYVLRQVSPQHLAAIAAETARRNPRAVEFYIFFTACGMSETEQGGWRAVERIADARPGDIIAWRRGHFLPGESTGHVVILASAPEAETDGTYRAVIIDSTTAPHADDTRPAGTSGVGRGTVWFEVDHRGRPTACRGNASAGFRDLAIAIGRPVSQ